MTKTPFRYAGAKNKLLPILMNHLDKIMIGQNTFCDAFVGGGSVLLEVAEKYPNAQLFANDKDPWVSSFWNIVADTDASKLDALLNLLDVKPTIEQFIKLSQVSPSDDLSRAHHAIFFNRCCFSGIIKRDQNDHVKSTPIGGKDQKSKWTVDCRFNFKKLKEKILNCHKLLSGRTTIACKDFSEYEVLQLSNYPTYLDPPYYYKANMLYNKYMLPPEHKVLATMLHNRSNYVLSYDDCSEIRGLYKDNQIIDVSARYCVEGKKTDWKGKNELIIIPGE